MSFILVCIPTKTTVRANYLWSFDCGDGREDLTGLYNSTPMNGAAFVPPGFSGQGKSLQLNRLLYQYATLPRSLNLTLNTSFTMSAWLLLGGYRLKNILTDCNNINQMCIAFIIEDTVLRIRIVNSNNGNILQDVFASIQDYNCQGCWMYVSFSFDYQTGSTVFYLNGLLLEESFLNLTYPTLQRTNKTLLSCIGRNALIGAEYFYGLIDQLNILYSVKNASELQYEATALFLYNFNTDNINADAGPNNIQANSQDVYRSIYNNQSALLFNSTESYFQCVGFTLLTSNGFEYSITFWLRLIITKPDKENSAIAVLQLSSKIEGLSSGTYSCTFSSHVYPNNGTIGLFFPNRLAVVNVNGSLIMNNTWTHIGVVYDGLDAYYFYQDGKLLHTDTNRRYSTIIAGNSRFSVSIGGVYLNNSMAIKPANYEEMKCFAGIPTFNYTKMYGEIDDFAFHARELTALEVAALANDKDKLDNI